MVQPWCKLSFTLIVMEYHSFHPISRSIYDSDTSSDRKMNFVLRWGPLPQ